VTRRGFARETAEDRSIGDDPAFSTSPFLTAKSLKVGVEILPLVFSRTLNVTGITLDNPQVTLLRSSAGQWNFASLASVGGKSNAQAQAAPDFSFKKIELVNGRIVVGRTGSQKRSTYDHVTLVSQGGEAEIKGAATLSKALLVAGGSPAGVPITVDFDTKYSLQSNVGVLKPSVLKIGSAAARLNSSGTARAPVSECARSRRSSCP
jgi:uncharacterized protein involved in outer membrane biogenesis